MILTIDEIKDYSTKVYEAAKNKGWYDQPVTKTEKVMLICSEVFEVLEADRKGKLALMEYFNGTIKAGSDHLPKDENFKKAFETYLKGTLEVEIADIYIRLFDFCGYYDYVPDPFLMVKPGSFNIIEDLYLLAKAFLRLDLHSERKESVLSSVFNHLSYICSKNKIDIKQFINLKMRYNELTDKRGKKY